jgi:two-component system phosphate regulon sensor histidine kinase PhoR
MSQLRRPRRRAPARGAPRDAVENGPLALFADDAGQRSALESRAAVDALFGWLGDDVPIIVDDRLRIVRAGAPAAELADRQLKDLAGMSVIAAFGSMALDGLGRTAVERGEPITGEVQLGRLGGRTFRVEVIPTVTGGLLLLLHDITILRRSEHVRRDFIANISHELRTPLSSIKLIAETLSSGTVDDGGTARDFAEQIEREVDHLAQLVDELLELSLIESGALKLSIEPVDPEQALRDVADRMGAVAERRRISLRVAEPPPEATGVRAAADPARLSQALVNLVHNAIKYSQPGGEVRLGWEQRPRRVRFVVSDDGVGISAAHLPRIFERFYKVDRSRVRDGSDDKGGVRPGSAGLGLAIVRHLAEAHSGLAGVESVEGKGSTFWLEVPFDAS